MYEELFYTRLTQLRTEKGVSARDMSLSIGQSAGYINNLENHKGLPSMTVFFYICEYFGVTPMEFFDNGLQYPRSTRDIVKNLQALDEEQVNHLSSIISYMAKVH